MLGASFLPARFRTSETSSTPSNPNWLNRQITPVLQSISRPACSHPIHTIVFVALLASTTYIGLLEGSLFDSKALGRNGSTPTDFNSLVEGGRRLRVGEDTAWKWTIEDNGKQDSVNEAADHIALMTFVFPDSLSNSSPQTAPPVDAVPIPSNSSVQILPSTSNPLSPISQDTTLVFAVPFSEAPEFLAAVREIPNPGIQREEKSTGLDYEQKKWITKVGKGKNHGTDGSFRGWAANAWTEFLDLVKNAETLDIVIMVLGYLSMHLTFVSLFLSMRRLGSNFWLATTVLFSSVFAFLFGLTVTTKLGVPITMVLLSEGLPFLVVTIGFEKPIILTKAVLSASLNSRRQGVQQSQAVNGGRRENSPMTIQNAVQAAVKEQGFQIVKDYCIEIAILVAGAASGVQGGLRQFCFLAAWILVFDCLLLFTFYTAILCIKLEINRIKRHVTLRKALEEDGVSRHVAENVASSSEWPRFDFDEGKGTTESGHTETAVFGKKVGDSSVPKFKVLMVSGFLIINLLNLCTIPFRTGNRNTTLSDVSALSNVLTPLPVDPFKVADNGLETLLVSAKERQTSTVVTVLPPIKYELGYPSVRDADLDTAAASFSDVEYTDQLLDVVGGKVIEGVLKSLEDPVLSKWIIVALTMSLVLNSYLFNAARWSIKESPVPEQSEADRAAQRQTAPNLTHANGSAHRNRHLDGVTPEPKLSGAADISETKVIWTPAEAEQMLRDKRAPQLNDNELIELSLRGKIPGYALEKTLEDQSMMSRLASLTRAVKIRRSVLSRTAATSETASLLEDSKLPYLNYNYENVHGACCENVIGYMPLPLGVAGPLVIDGRNYFLPMATTEGVLVASTSRGCKAINAGGGALTVLTGDGMTRGPCVGFETLARAGAAKIWLDSDEGQREMRRAFNSTSRFARLQTMKTALAGTYLYIRFKTTTGDAMGMNMISKGVENALNVMMTECGFDDMSIISVSGNFCTDKKPAAINWIDGRGKSVVAEAIIPGDVVRSVLKSDVNALVELNTSKNLIGSAMAGSIGGFNAHAANIVSAMFLATGQDPAQVVESANCITIMKKQVPPLTITQFYLAYIQSSLNGNLQISVSMPSIEVGTIGGGTILEPQMAMLDLLGVKGPHPTSPGANARQLARIIAAATLAGELSLCSALAAGHLVKAHMTHNRSAAPTRSSTPVSTALHAAPNRSQTVEGLSMTTGR